MDVSRPLRVHLQSRGETADAFAVRAQIGRSTVFNLLRGGSADARTVGKLLRAGVPISGRRLKQLLIDAA